MNLETRDIIKKKILDSRENANNYRVYLEKVANTPEAVKFFKQFAEESEAQAEKLEKLLQKYENEIFNYVSIH